MDRRELLNAVQAACERENVSEITEDFDLGSVDTVTRWIAARAIEREANRLIPDATICRAHTLGELLDAALPPTSNHSNDENSGNTSDMHDDENALVNAGLEDLRKALNN